MTRALALVALGLAMAACGGEGGTGGAGSAGPVELAHFPLSDANVPAGADAAFDPTVSQDGSGSLRVESTGGGRLKLYELDDLGDVEGRLIYTGFLKSENLEGRAFLEMWCHPAEGNAAFVRGIPVAVEDDTDWTGQEVGFTSADLCQDPTSIELNVVIEGAGTVWVDDLRLWSAPVE